MRRRMPLPMPIRPTWLVPKWLRRICIARFEHANAEYGDQWATLPNLLSETIHEIADVRNYNDFGRERGVPKLVVWAIEFMCGLQARLVARYFGELPPAEGAKTMEDVVEDVLNQE